MDFRNTAVYGDAYKTGIVVCQFFCLIYNALPIRIDIESYILIIQIFYYVPYYGFREWIATCLAYFDESLLIEFINDSLIVIQREVRAVPPCAFFIIVSRRTNIVAVYALLTAIISQFKHDACNSADFIGIEHLGI